MLIGNPEGFTLPSQHICCCKLLVYKCVYVFLEGGVACDETEITDGYTVDAIFFATILTQKDTTTSCPVLFSSAYTLE